MDSNVNKKNRLKRPDQPIYVPRHLRPQCSPKKESSKGISRNDTNQIKDSYTNYANVDVKELSQVSSTNLNEKIMKPVEEKEQKSSDDTCEYLPSLKESPMTNASPNKCSQISSQKSNLVDEDSWLAKFTDEGDAIDPNIMDEISEKVGKVDVKSSVIDYLEFSPKEIDMTDEEYCHLLEIYDFPKEFATQDLLLAFKEYQSRGFDIKWVDDTHAIAIFESAIAASNALRTFKNASFKLRPMSQSSQKTKLKAKKCTEFLYPQKPRPAMSAHVARNLLAAALGIKSNVSKEQRAVECQKITEARQKKKADMKSRQDAWEGTFTN